MIIVADAHISEASDNLASFFKMLEIIGDSEKDIIFLGDIFDLWLALPRYEKEIHHRFMAWCRSQIKHRSIGFIEGNHEFFLAEERHEYFTWCSPSQWMLADQGMLFMHGDLINNSDNGYLLLRKMTKNQIVKFILRYLPYGPRITARIKRMLEITNTVDRKYLPEDKIRKFADTHFANGIQTIFVGHFHHNYHYRNIEGGQLFSLPDWNSTGQVAEFDPESGNIISLHWEQLSQGPSRSSVGGDSSLTAPGGER